MYVTQYVLLRVAVYPSEVFCINFLSQKSIVMISIQVLRNVSVVSSRVDYYRYGIVWTLVNRFGTTEGRASGDSPI